MGLKPEKPDGSEAAESDENPILVVHPNYVPAE